MSSTSKTSSIEPAPPAITTTAQTKSALRDTVQTSLRRSQTTSCEHSGTPVPVEKKLSDPTLCSRKVSFKGTPLDDKLSDSPPGPTKGIKPYKMLGPPLLETLLHKTELTQEREDDYDESDSDDLESNEPTPRIRQSSISRRVINSWQMWRYSFRKDKDTFCPHRRFRILDRMGPFGQSRGRWAINKVMTYKTLRDASPTTGEHTNWRQELTELFLGDVYHTFLDAGLGLQLSLFAIGYITMFLVFACFYLVISDDCGLGLDGSYVKAYFLSMETMMTIGYGVPDPYMKGCISGAIVLTMQSLIQLLMAACLIGVIFQRLSRPQARACTIIFSKQAVIRQIDDAHYFMFRICDLRSQHTLIEPHVRCYCVRKHKRRGYEMVPMRLSSPDDALGSSLMLSLPTTVVHRIDAWSPLAARPQIISRVNTPTVLPTGSSGRFVPPAEPGACKERHRGSGHFSRSAWPAPLQRQADCETGNRSSCVCPTCGEAFGTMSMLQAHCVYNAAADRASGLNEGVCHKELSDGDKRKLCHEDPTRDDIECYLSSGHHLEVVVLVEGIEPTTSSSLQARHSYRITQMGSGTDIAWDMDFAQCCRVPRDHSRGLELDWSRFNLLEPEHVVDVADV